MRMTCYIGRITNQYKGYSHDPPKYQMTHIETYKKFNSSNRVIGRLLEQ